MFSERIIILAYLSAAASFFEATPEVWTKNFWGFFMRKKHDYKALLKYMRMLEGGYSFNYICKRFGINEGRLKYLWNLYRTQGTSALHRKQSIKANGELKCQIITDIEKNHLTLVQASLKYGVSAARLYIWHKRPKSKALMP